MKNNGIGSDSPYEEKIIAETDLHEAFTGEKIGRAQWVELSGTLDASLDTGRTTVGWTKKFAGNYDSIFHKDN